MLIGIAIFAFAALVALHADYLGKQLSYTFLDLPDFEVPTTVAPDRLWISAIGINDIPIIRVTERKETAYQDAVRRGVGHFPGTAEIGTPGNAYLFGHSSDYSWAAGEYKTVFALLPKLERGDEIIASDHAGNAHRYRVTETFVVSPEDLSVLDQFGYEKSLLTLQTSYPLGTALKRYIVRAELVPSTTE